MIFIERLKRCNLCPRNCLVNRYNEFGFCGANDKVRVAYYSLHPWEEPILSREKGSGTIFFSYCNLKCIFCQNKMISKGGYGKDVSINRLQEIYLELQSMGACNINLVTPTHYVPQIALSLHKVKGKELKIPIIYNTSSYENVSTIESLKDIVDVYLADFKYFDDRLGRKYSQCDDYFEQASKAVLAMFSQVGSFVIENGILIRGVVIRILLLPGHSNDVKKIINYLYNKYGDEIIFSIMSQYTPITYCSKYENLNQTVSEEEYNDVINYACDLGITNAFIQDGSAAHESFIPNFDCSNV